MIYNYTDFFPIAISRLNLPKVNYSFAYDYAAVFLIYKYICPTIQLCTIFIVIMIAKFLGNLINIFGHSTTINYPSKICPNQLPIFERWVAFAFNLLIFPFLISLLTSLGLSVRLWVNRSNVSLDYTGYRSNCQIICSFWE